MSLRVTFVLPDLPHFAGAYGGTFAHGLASMAAVLHAEGHTVTLIHLTCPPARADFVRRLEATAPDLVGFTSITHFFPIVREWIRWTREVSRAPIIVGGVHAILDPMDVMAVPEVDHVCTGEGELTLRDLCARLEGAGDPSTTLGTWSRADDGTIRCNPPRPLVQDLDALPFPDYSIYDYASLYDARHRRLPVMVSRGCPFSCTYCANASLRDAYPDRRHYVRFMSPPRAIAYIEGLIRQYPGITSLVFNDNILCRDHAWLTEFSALYRARVGLPFTGNMRPGFGGDDVPRLLREAGCERICMGVENGDEDIANRVLRRGQSNATIMKAFDAFRAQGIETVAYNILGAPFETPRTLLATIRLNARLRPSIMSAFIYYPFPGTQSHRVCREHGFLTDRHGLHNSEMVMIQQPTLTDGEVLFAHRFFRYLVAIRAHIDAVPAPLGGWLARAFDSAFTSPLLPRRALLALKSRVGALRVRLVSS